MKIGIIGCGTVGTALKNGFEFLGHQILIADPKFNIDEYNILNTKAVFICVPTNCNKDGSCNISIIKKVLTNLNIWKYNGIVILKSTVIPGTTERLSRIFKREITFVPEFLRERSATEDFINNQDLLVIGSNNYKISKKVIKIHQNLPKRVVICTPMEAELVKYFNNVYNATLITFANSFYEICKKLNVNYNNVKEIATLRTHINNVYLDCNEELRGFGGYCLPKDTKALSFLAKQLETNVEFFNTILLENAKYKTTVFKGMRL